MSNINVNNITPLAGTSGTVSVSGSLFVSGSITANGHITLGDSTADSLFLGAEVSSSIIPDTRNLYDLGSSDKGWSTLFLREITGSGVPGTFSGSLTASLDIVPSTTNVYSLGSSTGQWKDLYVDGVANIDTLGAADDGVTTAFINILSSSNSDMAGGGISCSVALIPSTDNKYDLGSSTLEWKDLFLDGTAHIDTIATLNTTGNSTIGNAAGNTHAFTGNITSSGNISASGAQGVIQAISGSFVTMSGTLTTATQPNITLVGTLGSLAVGNVTSTGNITAISMSAVWLSASSGIYGTLQTATQTNITSVGILTIVSSSGNSVLGDAVSDTHTFTGHITASGNISASGDLFCNDLYVADDVSLTSDSSVFNMGVNNDFTITHDGSSGAVISATPLVINSVGELELSGSSIDVNSNGVITMDSVGLSIDSTGVAANITSTTDGAAEDFTIALAGATDSSLILSSTGTGADALQISASAGGIDITATGAATIDAASLVITGAVTAATGVQSTATALTATDAGVAIPAGTAAALINADSDANHIVILPAPVVGNVINIIETATTGYELRSSTPASIAINGGTASNGESAIAGAITYIKCVCVSSTSWICSQYDADGDESKVEAAA